MTPERLNQRQALRQRLVKLEKMQAEADARFPGNNFFQEAINDLYTELRTKEKGPHGNAALKIVVLAK